MAAKQIVFQNPRGTSTESTKSPCGDHQHCEEPTIKNPTTPDITMQAATIEAMLAYLADHLRERTQSPAVEAKPDHPPYDQHPLAKMSAGPPGEDGTHGHVDA